MINFKKVKIFSRFDGCDSIGSIPNETGTDQSSQKRRIGELNQEVESRFSKEELEGIYPFYETEELLEPVIKKEERVRDLKERYENQKVNSIYSQ